MMARRSRPSWNATFGLSDTLEQIPVEDQEGAREADEREDLERHGGRQPLFAVNDVEQGFCQANQAGTHGRHQERHQRECPQVGAAQSREVVLQLAVGGHHDARGNLRYAQCRHRRNGGRQGIEPQLRRAKQFANHGGIEFRDDERDDRRSGDELAVPEQVASDLGIERKPHATADENVRQRSSWR